jgi:putative tricarboxylic transport membrane protein
MIEQILAAIDLRFIFLVFVGAFAGLIVGAMPGLSVTMATAILVSVTFTWAVNDAMALMMGVYVVGVFSGALSAILINIPGAPASVATTLDGFPMTMKGQAKKALRVATVYSFVGTFFGLIMLALLAKPVTKIALQFSPMDYFLLALFGLTTVGSLTSKNFLKGLISAALGVIISLIGIDPIMGTPRFTFGSMRLQAGISLIAALIGLFGFSEILVQIGQRSLDPISGKLGKEKVGFRQLLRHIPLSLQSAVIGTFIGALPGTGGPVASLIAYDQAKKTVRKPEVPFGEGAVEGIVASESANNACIGGALIPMLTLAVPGDAVTAVLLSAMYVHGLRPGPLLFTQTPDLFYVILAAGIIGSLSILFLGISVAPLMARMVLIPKKILLPVVAILCIIGAYAINSSVFDVLIMAIFGLIGFVMRRKGYSVAPMVLGIVLGSLMDANFRRAVSLASAGDNLIISMFSRPISIILIVFILISLFSNFKFVKTGVRKLFSKGSDKGQEE